MKQSLLSSTSLASATVAPTMTIGAGRPSLVSVRPASTLLAASMAGMLAAATPSDAAVIYSVNGVNAGESTTTGFTASKLYVGFGSGSFTTSPANIVGGMLLGTAAAGATYTTTVVLRNTAGSNNITVATGTTVFTNGFNSTTKNYGTINAGGANTLTNTYTYVPSTTGTVRGIAGSMTQDLLGKSTGGGGGATDTTTIVLISNWVAPVQSTTMTATAPVAGSIATSVTNQTATGANGFVYVLPGQSGAATVTVNNVGDGNMAADATTIATGFGNLSGTTVSSTSATGTGGFVVSSSSAAFSLNDKNAANIPATPAIVPTTSTTFTYTYTGNTTRGSSAAATLTVNFTNGNTDNTNASQTGTYTVVGRTVAPVQSISTTATALYALPNTAGPTQSLTITNTGDGSFVGANLAGTNTASTAAGVTVTNTGSFALTDTANGAAAASTTRTMTLSFTGGASRSAAGTVAQITSSFSNGDSTGANLAQSVVTSFTGQTVAPVQSTAAANTTIYALPGQAGTTQGTFNISNIGDGSRVGATLAGTLTLDPGGSFSGSLGNSAAIGLHDGVTGPTASTLTQTLTYTGAAARGSSTVATVTAAFSNGNSDSTNTAQSVTQTFTGITVAPVASTTTTGTSGTQYLLVGSGATVTGSLTVQNTGDGTRAGANLTGELKNTTAVGFSTTTAAGTISLGDSHIGGPNGTSLSQTLTYQAEGLRSGTVRVASSVATFSNGNANGTNAPAESVTVALSAQSVAPLASVTTTLDAGEIRVGTTSSVALTVKNTGDGNLAGADTPTFKTNLHGTVGTGSGSFSGAGGAVNLTDSSSSTYMFTYAPTARSNGLTESVAVTTTLQNGVTDANLSGNATTTLSAKAVGPVYQSSYTNAPPATVTTGTGADAGQVYGGTILFGDFVGGLTTQTLLINNITTDLVKSNATTLSLTDITITGGGEYSFTLSGFNSVIGNTATIKSSNNDGVAGTISIQFNQLIGNNSQLRIQTDEGVAFGSGTGTIYVYDLRWTVPEPGTLMVFGAGLLGLAISRRNRRGRNEAVRLTAGGDDAARG